MILISFLPADKLCHYNENTHLVMVTFFKSANCACMRRHFLV